MNPRAPLGYDLDMIPVPQEDARPWGTRMWDFLKGGGPWGTAQPGQRGTWVPSQINAQGQPELAVPGIVQQPAESLYGLMTAPLSDIVRSGDRDAVRAAAEASFDVAGALPAAGAAVGRAVPKAAPESPLRTYHGRRDPNPDFNVMRSSDEVWSSTNPDVASDYASKFGKVQGAVVPMDTTLSNPLRVQPPRGTEYDAIPFDGRTMDIRQLAKIARERGHDGMIVQGVMDSPELPAPPGRIGDTVVTFQKGSVKSPLTGETLFSNPDDPNTASLLAAIASMDTPGRMSGEEMLKAGTRRPANLNEPGVAQLEPGPRDTASFRGYQQGEVKPLYEYDPSKWRKGDVDPPPLSAVARMPIDKYDVWDAAQKPLATLRDRYGVRVSRDRHEPEPQQLAAALGRVEEVVRRTMQEGPPDRMMYPRMYVSIHNRTDGNVATVKAKTSSGIPELMVSANASADAIENALRGYFNPKPGRLMSNPDDPTTAAILAVMGAQDKPQGIKAYHGSPHDFDRFDLSKIGTGEGAQAYGHGLYFAENEGVARSYRDTLGNYDDNVKWKGAQPPTPLQQQLIDRLSGNDATSGDMMTTQKLRSELVRARRYVSDVDDNGNMVPGKGPNARRYQELTDLLDELKRSEQFIEVTPPGRMYEVNINASPEDFLDWDKPLSQQSEKVRGAAQQALGYKPDVFRGDEFVRALELERGGNADVGTVDRSAATKALREAGIPGIRYLDQGSRTAGEGSRNYVVFDDALIDILRKYSNAPEPTTAAILALLGQQGEKPHGLPMDKASRMARAKEMGFDTNKVVYHGTSEDFDEFRPSKTRWSIADIQDGFQQHHMTTARAEAETYGDKVKELYVRGKYKDIDNPMDMQEEVINRLENTQSKIYEDEMYGNAELNSGREYNYKYGSGTLKVINDYLNMFNQMRGGDDRIAHRRMRGEMSKAKREGFDGVRIVGGWGDSYAGDHYIAFDPKNIRSVDAAFDPAKSDSANLMASNPTTAAILALLAAQQGQDR